MKLSRILWAGAAIAAVPLVLTLGAQTAGSDHESHLKAYDAHKAMTSSSPFKNLAWSYLGPTNVSGRVADVAAADHGASRRLYAGTCCGGVWKSDDLGQTWQVVFDQAASTSIGALAVAPSNPDIVWVGTGESNIFRSSYSGVGVYKSVDNAKTWQQMGLADTGTIGRIVVYPTNPNIVYVASAGHEWTENETRGVFKTTDGGKSWQKALSISRKTGVNDIAMDPSDPNTLYAAAWERQRRHWNDPRPEPGFNEGGIFKTTDAGRTWTRLTNGLPPANVLARIGVAVAQSNPNVVYAFIDNYEIDTNAIAGARNPAGRAGQGGVIKGNEVYRSDDKGATWRLVSGQDDAQRAFMRGMSGTYAWVFGNIRVDPTDENKVYVLALSVSMSTDGGKTFGPIVPPPPPTAGGAAARGAGGGAGRGPGGDNHGYWIDPKNPKFMLSGNDSGFRLTTDGGVTWNRAPLPIGTWFDIAYDMDTPFHVVGSVQDHGSYRGVVDLRGGRSNLQPVAFSSEGGGIGGEYCEHQIDPTNPNIIYSEKVTRTDLSIAAAPRGAGAGGQAGGRQAAAPQPAGPQRTKNVRPPAVPGDDPLRMQVLAPLLLSPFDPNTIYFGAQYLFRSRNRGDAWEKLTGDLSSNDKTQLGDIPYQDVISISESPKKQGLIYAGTDDGHLHVTMDDGKTWTDLTSKLPQKKWVAKILASAFNESTVYLAQQGRYEDDFAVYLYKSTDYGKTWKSIGSNLPGGPMNMIREDPVSANVLYTCNDFGIYVTTNGGQKWDVLGGNLPSVNVMDFIVHPRDRVLVAATHGRGVWAIDVSGIK